MPRGSPASRTPSHRCRGRYRSPGGCYTGRPAECPSGRVRHLYFARTNVGGTLRLHRRKSGAPRGSGGDGRTEEASGVADQFFDEVSEPIRYEGPAATNPLAYKVYDADRL